MDLGRASQAVEEAIDPARGALGENAKAEVVGCQELCAPSHLDCNRASAAMCGVKIWINLTSNQLEEVLAALKFIVLVDGTSMAVSGNFLEKCNATVGNCHVQIPASEARRRVSEACLGGDQQELLAGLTWDNRIQRIVWRVTSADGGPVGAIEARGEAEPVCTLK